MAILSNFQANGQEAIKLAPPAQSVALTYTGNAQSPTWTEYPTSVITVTSTPQTNAGTYNATAAIPAGYVWADTLKGGQRNIPWTIGKASGGTIVLSKNAVEIGEGESYTVTATLTGAGDTLNAVSSDSSVAAVSVSGNTITITDGGTEGTATITVSADGNYTYTDVVIGATTQYVTIVTWASGTDEEIVAMVTAADAGQINLTDYWNIGDERVIHINAISQGTSSSKYYASSSPAQNVIFVLVDKNNSNYEYVSPSSSGRTYCNFVVQQKYVISRNNDSPYGYAMTINDSSKIDQVSQYGYSYTNLCSYLSSDANNYGYYKEGLPTYIKNIIKQVKVKYYKRNSSQIKTTPLNVFLPMLTESIKTVTNNTSDEYTRGPIANENDHVFAYYETSSNSIKHQNMNSNDYAYWTRSPSSGNNKYICAINTKNGNVSNVACLMNHSLDIAPCFCI